MNKNRKNSKIVRLFLLLALNNEEMKQLLCNDYKVSEDATKTQFIGLRIEEIALRLMDSRVFEYPHIVSELAQEFHNKFAKVIDVPNLVINFSPYFSENPKTEHQVYKYSPIDNTLTFNSMYEYKEAPPTFFLEQLVSATYMHRFQHDLKYLLKNFESLKDYKRHLQLSILLKNATMAVLTAEGKDSEREILEYEEDSSTASMVARQLTYNKIKEYLEWAGVYDSPHFEYFREEKADFEESILGTGRKELEEGTLEDEDEYMEGYVDRALEYDLELLKMLEDSNLNARSNGEIKELFLTKLDETAADFYLTFGLEMELGFKGEYEQFLGLAEGTLGADDDDDYIYPGDEEFE